MANHPTRPEIRLTEGAFYANDPAPHFAWMRANAPVYWDAEANVWGVTKYEDVRAVSKDPATYSNAGGIRPGVGAQPMMIDMDDPDHWNRRKLVNRGFTPRRVRDQEQKIVEVCDEIIDGVIERGTCDLVHDIATPLPLIMIGDSLGVAPEDRADLLRWSDDLVTGLAAEATEETITTMAAAFDGYVNYATNVIEDRRGCPQDDLMSILVHAEVDGDRLDDTELIFESLLILIGGDETTRHVISEGVYQLLLHPGQWQALLDDRSLVPGAVEEMLRWVSPLKNMVRTVTRDVELRGQQLREGDELMLLYPSANRDEEVFENPETFDIRRSPNDHVAFGFGSHFCLGNSLARLELKIMVERLLERMPDLELTSTDIPFRPANFVSGPESVPVRFSPGALVGPVGG